MIHEGRATAPLERASHPTLDGLAAASDEGPATVARKKRKQPSSPV